MAHRQEQWLERLHAVSCCDLLSLPAFFKQAQAGVVPVALGFADASPAATLAPEAVPDVKVDGIIMVTGVKEKAWAHMRSWRQAVLT